MNTITIGSDEEQAQKAKRVYKKLRAALERQHKGQVIAIEVDSGAYVLGSDEREAAREARTRFPGKIFYFFRIGEPALHKLR
jgi:hypothetical protein